MAVNIATARGSGSGSGRRHIWECNKTPTKLWYGLILVILAISTRSTLKFYKYYQLFRQEVDSNFVKRQDLTWQWYHYNNDTASNKTSNGKRTKLLVAQYTGPEATYVRYANITQTANRAYAKKWGFDYLLLSGVAFHSAVPRPGDATYNKLALLKKAMNAKVSYDAVLMIDADAVIVDLDQDIWDLIPSWPLISAFRVDFANDNLHTWNINIGVTVWNLRHEKMKEVYDRWLLGCYRRMNVLKWDVPDDQAPLQDLIKKYPLKQRKTMVNAMNTTHFMYSGGTFVKHFIRDKQTWATNENDSNRRETAMEAAVRDVCTKWKNACDDL